MSSGAEAVLDLDADPAPPRPRSAKPPVLGVRLPPHLVSYVKGSAARDGVAINAFLIGCVERDRDRELPMDVVDWLLTEAAQLGHPGDARTALVQVIRHLASLYPDGARLR